MLFSQLQQQHLKSRMVFYLEATNRTIAFHKRIVPSTFRPENSSGKTDKQRRLWRKNKGGAMSGSDAVVSRMRQ
jgi:hypothetical protein